MVLVKSTVLLVLLTAIYIFLMRCYFRANIGAAIKASKSKKFTFWFDSLIVLNIVMIVASVVYLLFLR